MGARGIAFGLGRTRWRKGSSLAELVVPTAVLYAANWPGISARDIQEANALWSVGPLPRLVAGATFVTCLFVSISAAVGVGVPVSMVLALINAARDVKVVRIVARGDDLVEAPVPARLDKDYPIIVLDVSGGLFFAGARSLGENLPLPGDARRPVVILRLRGYTRRAQHWSMCWIVMRMDFPRSAGNFT